jgi:hypothetical protein
MAEATLGLLPSYNLGSPRVQPFIETLGGVRFRDHCPEEVASLKAHMRGRNAIAHRGEQVTREDAQASPAAVLTMTQVLHELCYRALDMDEVLEEEAASSERTTATTRKSWTKGLPGMLYETRYG